MFDIKELITFIENGLNAESAQTFMITEDIKRVKINERIKMPIGILSVYSSRLSNVDGVTDDSYGVSLVVEVPASAGYEPENVKRDLENYFKGLNNKIQYIMGGEATFLVNWPRFTEKSRLSSTGNVIVYTVVFTFNFSIDLQSPESEIWKINGEKINWARYVFTSTQGSSGRPKAIQGQNRYTVLNLDMSIAIEVRLSSTGIINTIHNSVLDRDYGEVYTLSYEKPGKAETSYKVSLLPNVSLVGNKPGTTLMAMNFKEVI